MRQVASILLLLLLGVSRGGLELSFSTPLAVELNGSPEGPTTIDIGEVAVGGNITLAMSGAGIQFFPSNYVYVAEGDSESSGFHVGAVPPALPGVALISVELFTLNATNNITTPVNVTVNVTDDVSGPTITMSASPGRYRAPYYYTMLSTVNVALVLSEPCVVLPGNITAGNATVSNLTGDGLAYVFDLTALPSLTAPSLISAQITAGNVEDAFGNPSLPMSALNYIYDPVPPSVTSVTAFENDTRVEVIVDLDEFVLEDNMTAVTVVGGSATSVSLGGARIIVSVSTTFWNSSAPAGAVVVTLLPELASDIAGNGVNATVQVDLVYNCTSPPAPADGLVSVSGTGLSAVATYDCPVFVIGDARRACVATWSGSALVAAWSGTMPSCSDQVDCSAIDANCVACLDDRCNQCSGATPYVNVNRTRCIVSCPPGTYDNTVGGCGDCASSVPDCLTCTAARSCTSCSGGLFAASNGGSCRASCAEGETVQDAQCQVTEAAKGEAAGISLFGFSFFQLIVGGGALVLLCCCCGFCILWKCTHGDVNEVDLYELKRF